MNTKLSHSNSKNVKSVLKLWGHVFNTRYLQTRSHIHISMPLVQCTLFFTGWEIYRAVTRDVPVRREMRIYKGGTRTWETARHTAGRFRVCFPFPYVHDPPWNWWLHYSVLSSYIFKKQLSYRNVGQRYEPKKAVPEA